MASLITLILIDLSALLNAYQQKAIMERAGEPFIDKLQLETIVIYLQEIIQPVTGIMPILVWVVGLMDVKLIRRF